MVDEFWGQNVWEVEIQQSKKFSLRSSRWQWSRIYLAPPHRIKLKIKNKRGTSTQTEDYLERRYLTKNEQKPPQDQQKGRDAKGAGITFTGSGPGLPHSCAASPREE